MSLISSFRHQVFTYEPHINLTEAVFFMYLVLQPMGDLHLLIQKDILKSTSKADYSHQNWRDLTFPHAAELHSLVNCTVHFASTKITTRG